ncbi:type I secretion system permease/ATPase [Polynucleobacter paneuropaeus]|nr:type I secretion system permease/ATPase [Polynucleobacter paneuropaeus]
MEIDITPASERAKSVPKDPIEQCVIWVLERFDKHISPAALRARVARMPGPWSFDEAIEAIDSFGIRYTEVELPYEELVALDKTLLLETSDGHVVSIIPKTDVDPSQIFSPHIYERAMAFNTNSLSSLYTGRAFILEEPIALAEGDSKTHHGRFGHWFFGPVYASKHIYAQVAIAALLTNIFALATSGFSMIVYDRVMPNGGMDTLIALVIGVFLIFFSDFIIRTLRSYFLDVAGAQADMVIADTLFEQMVDMQMASRKGPVGSIANSLREFETLREFMTSATMTTLIDIPFSILFLLIIWAIGGPIVFIPLMAIFMVVAINLFVHPKLKKLTQTTYEDGQTKHGIAIETLQGIETIKAMGAGAIMRRRWQDAIAHQSIVSLKTRMFAQLAGNVSNFANQFVWVLCVTVGVFMIQEGKIGMGAIMACSMLAGRSIAPLAQLTQLLTRLNQSIASYKSLSNLMQQPREHTQNAAYLNRDEWNGSVEFKDVSFNYPDQTQGGLNNVSFKINSGERVALIGKIGSGKTTIAKLLLGLYQPTSGAILIDGIDLRQIDPADLRRNIGSVMQDIWLMTGTVKHNIAVGGLNPNDEDILLASELAGVHDFIAPHPDGYGLRLKERGEGLSGGQKQAIAIARALVGRPPIILMDEPTSSMDMNGEKVLIEKLKRHLINQTIIVITHRSSIIDLVDRVIVIDQGKVAAQGPKSDFIKPQTPVVQANNPPPAPPSTPAPAGVAPDPEVSSVEEVIMPPKVRRA